MKKKEKPAKKRIPRYFEMIGSLEEICKCYKEKTGRSLSQEIIEHEQAHYNKAIELEYPLLRFKLKFGRSVFTTIRPLCDEEITSEDIIQIALAPKDPSFDDRYIAIKLQRELENRYENSGVGLA